MAVVNRLEQLILDKSSEWQRRITLKEISEATGISETTLIRMRSSDSKGIRYDVLDRLCKFFEVGVGDIIHYVPDEPSPE
jgi:DNA-binding Xre family transcriptional regulator